MSATPGPSTGEPPVRGPKTCDASGMFAIHRMLQRSFDEAVELVGGVPAGDVGHAKVVATQLNLISNALHAHHEGEDTRLWDMIDQRAPACFLHVERMKVQHAAMLVHLQALDEAVPAWRASAALADAEPVRVALAGVSAALAAHFPDEEANIVPVIEHVVAQSEVDWFAKHGRKATPRGQGWNMLGAILAGQPDGGAMWLRKHMPGPVGLIWRFVGAPRYARFRAALEGRRR
ncbi:hemerythrin domain-containing protein [Actinophytocola oryzae]|uniref:Hemerythrin HHE cation binding domain-containing protein n=1 Tax=Actinophytocola oryzae TaxID=502181 RepID=A0A4R7W195_9PSEU|nr:hemerythrin domain-containing protein [Actinophytocola oryzae]TDV56320.1 hemerythrin HHE cation binding domain-containing protein [Actinophytocola oryzae]